ncbi:MAG: hypothetical protein ACP5HU_12275 [Phycisphaerae bacterium]
MKDYSKLKKVAIVALLCLNVGLSLALVYGAGTSEASAQARPGYRSDYLVVTGRHGQGGDAIYVMDLAQRRLAAWRFDVRNQTLVPFVPGRELNRDFDREEE